MSKELVTTLFIVACVAVVAGLVVGVVAVVIAVADGAISIGGPDVVTIDGPALGGALVGLLVASLVVAAGAVAALASWFGALLNTARLENKTWFVALLVLGLVSLGWVAMVAYIVAGPDSFRDPASVGVVEAAPSSQKLV
jgi:hypothetical protein